MNEKVAEVMGWTVELVVNSPWDAVEEWRDPQGRLRLQTNPPPYSTDMAFAWDVVEKLTAGDEGWTFNLHTHVDGWRATLGIQHSAIAATAPLAICRAALATAGVSLN